LGLIGDSEFYPRPHAVTSVTRGSTTDTYYFRIF
jgi:hypothetical protein